jgi:peptidoglycan/xylan/chitin deacetylase (PgdA/CDA1 family)
LEVLRPFRRKRLDEMDPKQSWFGGVSVAITFDDGYTDNYQAAARILERHDTPATFFIATGFIGERREYWWDELEQIAGSEYFSLYEEFQPMPHDARRHRLDKMFESAGRPRRSRSANLPMSLNEVTALAANDLFEIGAHTVTHPLLSAQTREVQYYEVRESKGWLEALVDRCVTSFSYPYGGSQHYDAVSVAAVREAGFERACTTDSRSVSAGDGHFEWPRIAVTDMDGDAFQNFLQSRFI